MRCGTSRPPVPEQRLINRLHAEKMKRRKDAAEAKAERKRKRKARHVVAEFPRDPADLWRIKMRPEPGYISLVSFGFELVMRRVVPFS